MALEPPPTQAMTASGSREKRSTTCLRDSAEMTVWKWRTIVGKGWGPVAEPRM